MNGIKARFLMRVTVCTIFCLSFCFLQNDDVRAADSCVTCHTDEEMLQNNLSKDDKEKSSMQAGPG